LPGEALEQTATQISLQRPGKIDRIEKAALDQNRADAETALRSLGERLLALEGGDAAFAHQELAERFAHEIGAALDGHSAIEQHCLVYVAAAELQRDRALLETLCEQHGAEGCLIEAALPAFGELFEALPPHAGRPRSHHSRWMRLTSR
jgi:hypothetical protein